MPTHIPSYKSYITGFITSIVLTYTAYYFVDQHIASNHVMYPHQFLIPLVLLLALLQFVVQIIFFLHIHKGTDRGSNIAIFLSTLSIVIILIGGSLWIMNNLNYHMTPDQINQYMYNQG